MTPTLSARLDFARELVHSEQSAKQVADLLSRSAFAALERVSGRHKDRWAKHAERSRELIAQYLTDPAFDAVSLDSKRGQDLVASAEIESSLRGRRASPTALSGYLVLPVDGTDSSIETICELAAVLQAGAGFIAAEPDYAHAHRVALGASRPTERDGLSELRQRGRRARHWKSDHISTMLATVEWGTFLGPGHLAQQMDIAKIRSSGAFERVVEVSPNLVYLQVTANSLDDVSGELEKRLPKSRDAMEALLMDLSDVNLD